MPEGAPQAAVPRNIGLELSIAPGRGKKGLGWVGLGFPLSPQTEGWGGGGMVSVRLPQDMLFSVSAA